MESTRRFTHWRAFLLLAMVALVSTSGCGRKRGAPITVLKQRVVKTDIEDHYKFYRLLGVGATGGALPGLAGGGSVGFSSGGGEPAAVISFKDDPAGDAMFFKIRLSEKFITESGSGNNLLTAFSSADVQLRSADESNSAILLFTGSLQKEGRDVEKANYRGIKIERNGTTYKVEPDGVGILPDDKEYQRAPVSERLAKTQPPTIADNIFIGGLEAKDHAGWETAELVCLIRIPKDRSNVKLVVFNDASKAIDIKL